MKQNYVSDVEVGLPLHWWSGKTSKKQTHKSLNGLSIVVSGMAKKQQKTSQEWGNDDDEDDASDKKISQNAILFAFDSAKTFLAF